MRLFTHRNHLRCYRWIQNWQKCSMKTSQLQNISQIGVPLAQAHEEAIALVEWALMLKGHSWPWAKDIASTIQWESLCLDTACPLEQPPEHTKSLTISLSATVTAERWPSSRYKSAKPWPFYVKSNRADSNTPIIMGLQKENVKRKGEEGSKPVTMTIVSRKAINYKSHMTMLKS